MSLQIRSVALAILLLFLARSAAAFELATEGTMRTVSIVASNSAEELLNAAKSHSAYRDLNYEMMPFETSMSISMDDTDLVTEDLNFAHIQEVDKQVTNIASEELSLLADTIKQYVPNGLLEALDIEHEEVINATSNVLARGKNTVETVFSNLQQTFHLLEASVNKMSYSLSRYMEQVSIFNLSVNPEQSSLGDFHTSNIQSTSNIIISGHE